MKIFRDEDGQTLVLTVLCMTALLGFMALALDVGVLFRARRNMQIAADAAAMAGATELFYNGTTKVQQKALAAAKSSGVDSAVSGNTVIVTLPPVSLGGTSCASCVEVQLATPNPTVFMGMITHKNFLNVSAKAVGGAPTTSGTCVYVMNPTASNALWIHGAGAIIAPNCGVYVNSDDPGALCVTGSAGKSTFGEIDVVGGQGKANCGGDPGGKVATKSGVQTDPWASLPDPSKSCNSGNTTALTAGTLTGTIAGPGYGNVACYSYSVTSGKGKNITTTPTAVTLNGATLGAGTYVFTTGVNVTGTDTVGVQNGSTGKTASGGGATLAVSSGSFTIATNSALSIFAPTDGTYNGLALYQSPGDMSPMTVSFGSSTAKFNGMVYAPTSDVTLHDEGGGGLAATGFVVGTIYVNGKVNLTSYNVFNPTTTPFKVITLVE